MHFSIRPVAKEEESLTSWLMRICKVNFINFNDLVSRLSIYYKSSDPRTFHQIDINPARILDLQKATIIINKDSDFFLDLTFCLVLKKFIRYWDSSINLKKNFLFNSIITQNRRFCVECLKEDIYFKLKWQISHIKFCDIHKTKLISHCFVCQRDQPYFHERLLDGLCKYCGNNLIGHTEILQTRSEFSDDIWFHEQWSFLLQKKLPVNFGYMISQNYNLLHLLFFICGSKLPYFDIKEIGYISRDYKYKLINLLLNSNSQETILDLNLDKILEVIKLNNLTWNSLSQIIVQETYLNSLQKYLDRDYYIKCLTPWCKYKNSHLKMQKIINYRSKTHNNLHFCSKCLIKYGINKKTKKWEEYGDFINLGWKVVFTHLEQRLSKLKIANICGISRFKVTKFICYFAQQKLLTKDISYHYLKINEYIPTIKPYFLNITFEGEVNLIKQLMEKNGWSQNEAYYYFFDPIVQNYLLSNGGI